MFKFEINSYFSLWATSFISPKKSSLIYLASLMTFKFVKPHFAWIVYLQMKARLSLGSKFVDRRIYKEV